LPQLPARRNLGAVVESILVRDIPQDPAGSNRLPALPGSADATFARRVRDLREIADLTQRRLAEQMTVMGYRMHQTTIAKIEAGERPVSIGEAVAFASVLGVEMPDLLAGPSDPDLADAIVARDMWARRRGEVELNIAALRRSLAVLEEEDLAEAAEEEEKAAARVVELHDAGFKDEAAKARYYAKRRAASQGEVTE
jgi:transcriptional regulator with XRE-family HTH domain